MGMKGLQDSPESGDLCVTDCDYNGYTSIILMYIQSIIGHICCCGGLLMLDD